MKTQMYNTVEVLKTRVNYNLNKIKENELKIRGLVHIKIKTNKENNDLIECFNENKLLLSENKDAINLQMNIIQYITQFSGQWRNENFSNTLLSINLSDEDLFDHTVDGKIPYDKSHPKYSDKEFAQKLLKFYTAQENYEMCDLIIKSKQ